MIHRSTRNLLWGLVFVALTGTIRAAEPYPLAPPPTYPPITLSTWYEVDPSWPQRPEGMPLGRTPGVFVDGQDQVWLFTRANPPVQIYTTGGKFVRAWGEGLIGATPTSLGSHQIRIDREGRVWLADTANHVVLKCTQEGKLLQTLGTPGRYGCDESHFNRPTDMAVTPDGQIFVRDRPSQEPLSRREASHHRRIDPETVKQEMAAAGFRLKRDGLQPSPDRFLLVFAKKAGR